jgi:hypothetical protein
MATRCCWPPESCPGGAPGGEVRLRKEGDIEAVHPDGAGVGPVDAGDQVEQGRLP